MFKNVSIFYESVKWCSKAYFYQIQKNPVELSCYIIREVSPSQELKGPVSLCSETSLSQHTSFQTREDVGSTLVYLLSQVQLFVNPWIAACQSPLSSTISRICSNSCPFSWWCYLTVSSSAAPFFCLQFSQHQSLFQWVSSSHQVAKVFELKFQQQSFQWILRVDFL